MLRAFLALLYVLPCVYGWYMPQTYPPYDPKEARMVRCPNYNLSKLGCHNARDPSKPDLPRAVPEMILTTDSSNNKYVGYKRSTFPTYQDFLARFICDCAEKVRGKGYTHFSISNYFECWSGKNVANTYDMYKIADGCVRGNKRHCDTNNQGPCAGAGGLHFVYALKSPNPTGITTTALTPSISTQSTTLAPSSGLSVKCGYAVYKLRKLGCWNERDYSRAFPELLLTATDYYNQRLYAGYYLDIKNYETFLQRFVCDCASLASTKGYSIFGIRSYGQCWSGPNVACTYQKHGRANDCINQKHWQCSDSRSMLCASPYSKSVYAFVLSDSKDGTTCGTKPSTKPQTTPRVTTIITPSPKTTPKVVTNPKTTPVPKGKPSVTCGNVRYKLVKLGCWKEWGDVRPPRAMPELILTARDKKSKVYAGYEFNRYNYAPFLERFICDCISKIKQKGYSIFGLQLYGQCWSGAQVGCSYQKFGQTKRCVNQNMVQCSDDSTMLCSGDTDRNTYVYVPDNTPVTCPTNIPTKPQTTPQIFTTPQTTPRVTTPIPKGPPVVKCGNVEYKLTKLGCWNELGDIRPPRVMPELLLTSRDRWSNVYVGYDFDTHNYAAFLKRFICDCINKVNQKGYLVFGLQFYGECWSGARAGCTYEKFGKANGCVNENHARCSDDSRMLCSGDSPKHTYVYVPADSPNVPLCPTTIPTKPQTTPKVTPKVTPQIFTTPQTTPRVTTPIPKGPPVVRCGNVEYKLTKLGCWNELGDIRPPRAMPEILLTSRDKRSDVYVGYDFDQHNYAAFLKRFVCDCINKVNQKGYSVFGLQFYGECWSGARAGCTYEKFGKANGCANENHARCSDDSTMLCSGDSPKHTYVYVPANSPDVPLCPTTIPTQPKTTPKVPTAPKTTPIPVGPPRIKCGNIEYQLTKLGCWKEFGHVRPPRVLPELLLTAKDTTSSVYVGYKFYKQKYEDFIHRFACDCVTKVKQKGYSVFGLQFYGECWSGPRAACTYKTFGKSYKCLNEKLGQCWDKSSRLCSGKNTEDMYVYIPADTPGGLTCPTTIPTTPKITTPTKKITTPTKKITTPTKKITTPTKKITTPTKKITTPKTTPIPIGPPRIKCGNIEYQLTKLGCWKEFGHIRSPRVLPELLLTAKDTTSSVYVGYKFYKQKYEDFIHRFACDCVTKVKQKGYSVFGLQFYGECWSGPRAACTYKTFGKSYKCLNEKLGQCWDKSTRLCSGENTEDMYVYIPADTPGGLMCPTTIPTTPTTPKITTPTKKIATPTKKITTPKTTPIPIGPPRIKCGNIEYQLTKLGCWKEFGHVRPPRVLPELLLTAKDTTSSVYVGYKFYKQKYEDFIHRFACDCVTKVKQKGYSVFGLQFYGECWSGPRAACTYKTFGKSYKCLNEKLGQCWDKSSRLCSGKNTEDMYVYIPADTPGGLTCPTTIPTTPKITTPTKKITTPTKKITTPTKKITTPKTTPIPIGPPRIKCGNIEYQLTKLGCWKEFGHIRSPRVLPELLLTAKDTTSSVYVGYKFYKQKYEDFIHRFACDCVTKVKQKGYSVFGLQFYGECWSGPRTACTYKTFGKSYKCVDEKLGKCLDTSSRLCSGQNTEDIYVYIPADTPGGLTCPTTIPTTPTTPTKKITTPKPTGPPRIKCGNVEYRLTKLGCWKDLGDITPPRAMPELLLTARDKWSNVYVGYDYHKMGYEIFINRFICDCVNKVNHKGYSVFGLQFYGECWSGPQVGCTYKKFGQANECVDEKLKICSDSTSRLCAGHSSQETYVYVPTYPPPAELCPSTPPTSITTVPTPTPTGPPSIKCGNVEYKLRKLGCWSERSDSGMPRAIPELMLTARDSKSNVYAGYQIDTSNYAQFIKRFICDCITKVNTNGYSIFGLQFYGECWSGKRAECTYKRYGQSNRCMNERKGACSDKSSMVCSGDSPRNAYVYARADVALPTCPPISTVTTRSTPPAPTTLTVSPITPVTPQSSPATPTVSPTRTTPVTSVVTTPSTTPFIPINFECKKALDIVIAIDASGSVMSVPYLRIRNFVNSLTQRFTSFKPTYFGLLHYNYKVITSAKLTEQIPNSQTLRNRIRDMRYLGQATLTQSALTSAKELFDNGARNDSDVQKILILFTDGRTYGGKQTLREPLKRLRESGVRVTAVAVGSENYLDRYSLLLIAENQTNLVIIPSLDNLGQIQRYVDRVAYMVCPK